ncbi:uncharacterized protein LOC115735206 isoform X2 [Rhodamnia argentea]|uniref:Uncharacterized protein LOC115735206 isoform X2 n=1 Tax=Rhodamnia argentea TaxID=178133 RepID=A0A8B8NJB3_9MYRT|nr:uncharacterized protein LOC115735206 isoform X2 [Rhodamnia argentea]
MEAEAPRGMEQEEPEPEPEPSPSSSSVTYKLVPWLSWDEWDSVRASLFSPSPDSVASALRRITAWRSRGCLPVAVEVTASIIEIQQKDPFFRLVNGVVEKTRKKTEVSIAEAANAIGIPRMLIDIRHEGSHRELPALPLVRDASRQALSWLKSYYWEPQKKAMPSKRYGSLRARKEVKSKLRELAIYLRNKQSPPSTSLVKEKSIKHCGRSKVLLLVAGRLHTFKSGGGSKKTMSKILKNLVQLYASFSTEVISVLLEFLLKVVNSSDTLELQQEIHYPHGNRTLLDDWMLLMTKLINKEPKMLLDLLKAVLDMIDTEEASNSETGTQHLMPSRHRVKTYQIAPLSSLFAWLVAISKGLKSFRDVDSSSETEVPDARRSTSREMLMGILRKSLRVGALGNKQLMDSAIQISEVIGNNSLVDKLNKLSLVSATTLDVTCMTSSSTFAEQEDYLRLAAEKLVRLSRVKNKALSPTNTDGHNKCRWAVAKSWNPCPIGTLPLDFGFSGRLPVLDCKTGEAPEAFERNSTQELNQCAGKREASCDADSLLDSRNKKMREAVVDCELEDMVVSGGAGGCLMLGGVWKKVGLEELEAIKSSIRILV